MAELDGYKAAVAKNVSLPEGGSGRINFELEAGSGKVERIIGIAWIHQTMPRTLLHGPAWCGPTKLFGFNIPGCRANLHFVHNRVRNRCSFPLQIPNPTRMGQDPERCR